MWFSVKCAYKVVQLDIILIWAGMNCDIAKHFYLPFFAFESAYNVTHAGKSGVR